MDLYPDNNLFLKFLLSYKLFLKICTIFIHYYIVWFIYPCCFCWISVVILYFWTLRCLFWYKKRKAFFKNFVLLIFVNIKIKYMLIKWMTWTIFYLEPKASFTNRYTLGIKGSLFVHRTKGLISALCATMTKGHCFSGLSSLRLHAQAPAL
jgi:hypothetical protein